MGSEQISSRVLSRRKFLRHGLYGGLTTGLLPCLWVNGCSNSRQSEQPNIILISIDTLRSDHLGCYGYKRPTSPFLDEFSSKCVLFEDVTAPSPWTLPSHGSLLTGYYPSRLGLTSHNSVLDADAETLAMLLSNRGLATGAVVNSLYLAKEYGFARGFGQFKLIPESHQPRGAAGSIIDLAKQWLNSYRDQQFFFFLHFYDVHSDYRSMPEYRNRFVKKYRGKVDGSTEQLLAFREGGFPLDSNDLKHLIDLYDAEISQLDERLSILFDFLGRLGVLKNSYVIITSDHGEEFLDHGGVLHGRTQYQELIHVPLLIGGPGIPGGRRVKNTVSLVDVTPTVLGLVGADHSGKYEGVDLSPLWKSGDGQLAYRFIFAEADHNNVENDIKRAVRQGAFKLHFDRLTEKTHLYDLQNDPEERLDIAEERPQVVGLLLTELKSFMQKSRQDGATMTLTPENIERLKSLGYI